MSARLDTAADPADWIPRPKGPRPNGAANGRLRVLSVDDLLVSTPRDYIIKGWISPGEISLVVGAKNTRKSFFCLHTAYAVSLGRDVFGRRVKQANALYIVCEGEKGIGKRVKALVRRYGKSANFHVIAQPIDLLHRTNSADDLAEIIEAARLYDIGLVFMDTVSRAMPGGKEDAGDMGAFLHNLNVLRHETGAHIAGVHHGTKEDGINSRGHSTLPNGADVIVQMMWNGEDEGTGTATIGFARDDKTGLLGAFTAEEIILGQDEDGDDVTTLLVNELEPSAVSPIAPARKARQKPLKAEHQTMLVLVKAAIAGAGQPVEPRPGDPFVRGITRSALRKRLIDDGWFSEHLLCADKDGGSKLERAAYGVEYNALTALKSRDFLHFSRDVVWLPS